MDAATRVLVRARAGHRCEYCLLQQEYRIAPLQVEPIIARQHRGGDDTGNLAPACTHCNLHKGPNLSGIDPASGAIVPLFHPRREAWADHFRLQGPTILGLTPTGRVTVHVLAMNSTEQIELRVDLLARGAYP